jgi:hypothetical protein
MTINLHELANAPYAGNAEKALRNSGNWDDARVMGGKSVFKVKVEVSGTYEPAIETEYFTVEASTKEEAIELAEALAGFDEIEDSEIVSMTRVSQ